MLFFPAGARLPPGLLPWAGGMGLGQGQPLSLLVPLSRTVTPQTRQARSDGDWPYNLPKGRVTLLFLLLFHQGLERGEA